ncbi:anthrone oxygenase family protein [Klenkia sp. PcliD-1-E]|uniref:anthrone oxygenase family protein n=1 Tax=Klenkia sp. PcliD-1-E TaxID=2954492 RepID=UPI002096C9B4|nr:anthrone oxygenase family protein [Klenkia sp. PcliD-1-E]MCO7219046.1 DUF1772 domain-containing protein [Klenkia sp. PcliD-1-E]
MELLGTLTAVGCALVGGVFFAFSGFVMAGLGRAPDGAGAMRAVNVAAVRPPLMVLLFGTAAACVAVLVVAPEVLDRIGAGLYLVGTVGVTVAANVPLNDALERDPDTWPRYLRVWTRWNTLRTVSATAAAVLLLVA